MKEPQDDKSTTETTKEQELLDKQKAADRFFRLVDEAQNDLQSVIDQWIEI